jgi:hypothetical protein
MRIGCYLEAAMLLSIVLVGGSAGSVGTASASAARNETEATVLPAVPRTTRILGPAESAALSSVGKSMLRFTKATPLLRSLSPGDVIVSGVTARLPNGLLRTVKSVENKRNHIDVQTGDATMPSAITQGSIVLRGSVPHLCQTVSTDLYTDTTGHSITLQGQICFSLTYAFSLVVTAAHTSLSSTLTVRERAFPRFRATGPWSGRRNTTLLRYYLPPRTVSVGTVPVVITPEVVLVGGASGNLTAGVAMGAAQDVQGTVVLGCQALTCRPHIGGFVGRFSKPSLVVTGSATFTADSGPNLGLLLYGRLASYLGIRTYLEAAANPSSKPRKLLYGRHRARSQFYLDVLFTGAQPGTYVSNIGKRQLLTTA